MIRICFFISWDIMTIIISYSSITIFGVDKSYCDIANGVNKSQKSNKIFSNDFNRTVSTPKRQFKMLKNKFLKYLYKIWIKKKKKSKIFYSLNENLFRWAFTIYSTALLLIIFIQFCRLIININSTFFSYWSLTEPPYSLMSLFIFIGRYNISLVTYDILKNNIDWNKLYLLPKLSCKSLKFYYITVFFFFFTSLWNILDNAIFVLNSNF